MFLLHLQKRQVFVDFEVTEILPESWSPTFKVNNSYAIKILIWNESVDVDFELTQMQIEASILGQSAVRINQSPVWACLDRRPDSWVVQNRNFVAS